MYAMVSIDTEAKLLNITLLKAVYVEFIETTVLHLYNLLNITGGTNLGPQFTH